MGNTLSFSKVIQSAAKRAGQLVLESANEVGSLQIEEKSKNDFVSEVDRKSEQLVRDIILQSFPEHTILGEEFGGSLDSLSKYCWVIDPLDGTTNFIRGIPHYAVSIALLEHGRPVVACIYDPSKNECFFAEEGRGAFLNDLQISCSDRDSISGGLYATGVPFSGVLLDNLACFNGTMTDILQTQTSGIRRLGSAALDLAYVAAGRYDGFWEANLKIWDIAAGVLLVQEAAGAVCDLGGGANYLSSGHILASNWGSHKHLLQITQKNYSNWQS